MARRMPEPKVLEPGAGTGLSGTFRFRLEDEVVPAPPGTFRTLAKDAGMAVVGPPLAQSHPS
jgi:hypothetical protein